MSELKIKIGNTAYFFCKDIAVSRKQKDPVILDLSKIDLQTAKAIARGLQAGAIQALTGEKELKEIIANFTMKQKLDKLDIKEEVQKIADVQKEEVKVEEVKPTEEVKTEETKVEEVKTEELAEVKPKATRQKRSTTKVEE